MTLRFENTPLAAPIPVPNERGRGRLHDLASAVCHRSGLDAPLAKLADPDVLVVTTGQQPGLLTGPLYTIHKALSARALALRLEAQWRRPVVPVFWVAGDDHDYDEGSAVSWIGADGALVERHLPPRAEDAPLTPLYREPLPAEITEILADLERSLPPGPSKDQTLAWLNRSYQPGKTLGHAFGAALAELLAPLGIVCLDASARAVKQAAAPLLLEAVERTLELEEALREQREILEQEGVDSTVAVGGGATLVFLEASQGRDRLVVQDGGFVTRRSRERFSLDELRRIAAETPMRLSPNVLLRPVVESALLPTTAYLAGPAELRYLALAAPLYHKLEVPRQQPTPRWSGFLIEPRVERTAAKLGLSLDDLRSPTAALEQRLAAAGVPAELSRTLERLHQAVDSLFPALVQSAVAVDPTLERPVAGAQATMHNALKDVEKRILQHQKRKESETLAQLARARTAILPGDRPQERVLSIIGFVGRYGFELLSELADHIEAWYATALAAGVGHV